MSIIYTYYLKVFIFFFTNNSILKLNKTSSENSQQSQPITINVQRYQHQFIVTNPVIKVLIKRGKQHKDTQCRNSNLKLFIIRSKLTYQQATDQGQRQTDIDQCNIEPNNIQTQLSSGWRKHHDAHRTPRQSSQALLTQCTSSSSQS